MLVIIPMKTHGLSVAVKDFLEKLALSLPFCQCWLRASLTPGSSKPVFLFVCFFKQIWTKQNLMIVIDSDDGSQCDELKHCFYLFYLFAFAYLVLNTKLR